MCQSLEWLQQIPPKRLLHFSFWRSAVGRLTPFQSQTSYSAVDQAPPQCILRTACQAGHDLPACGQQQGAHNWPCLPKAYRKNDRWCFHVSDITSKDCAAWRWASAYTCPLQGLWLACAATTEVQEPPGAPPSGTHDAGAAAAATQHASRHHSRCPGQRRQPPMARTPGAMPPACT